MLAVIRLTGAGDVYGVQIDDEIERRTRRSVAPAAVYITLRRLEQKGLVASWMSEPTQERGGKARRSVKLTRAGLQALRDAREAVDQMWSGLDPKLEKIR